ncbi:DUF4328 domain-containing protein [Actinophytocola gossypii]|uniref:DUF4328 domain-containing protein n=1 Tax=Actinophytocola gossypii TaxID=2812003 RepID=A0ABT2JH58_9PSEU|nr:DUF4328 domain-containing protein [Actinophytocola gossypii]MCT2586614.1 DUF4328 domain-containing protein [Actinophytocola gossypii]
MTRWVASVPGGVRGRAPRRRLPYLGPPSYQGTPRWGFPALAWRWPTAVPGANTVAAYPVTVERVRSVGGHAAAMMWTVAALTLLAAGGEVWRYVLLVRSRQGALSDRLVAMSDTVVTVAAVLALAFAVLTAIVTVWWLVLARQAAADSADQGLPRPTWQVLVYLAIPGVNLAMAGVFLAELEHQALHRPAGRRPRPTRATAVWWAAWVVSGVLFGTTIAWRFRDGVQAQADGVLLTAATDLAAVAVAVLTALTIRRVSTLLAPIDPERMRHLRVIRVIDAPAPELRRVRTTPSRR